MVTAPSPHRSFFARTFDRLVEARMESARRQVELAIRSLPEEDRRFIEEQLSGRR